VLGMICLFVYLFFTATLPTVSLPQSAARCTRSHTHTHPHPHPHPHTNHKQQINKNHVYTHTNQSIHQFTSECSSMGTPQTHTRTHTHAHTHTINSNKQANIYTLIQTNTQTNIYIIYKCTICTSECSSMRRAASSMRASDAASSYPKNTYRC
jgi:hypothetical protein